MPRFARRTFLSSLAAAAAAPSILRAADKRKERFPIAFSIRRRSFSSSGATSVKAAPVASARAVRPTRWM